MFQGKDGVMAGSSQMMVVAGLLVAVTALVGAGTVWSRAQKRVKVLKLGHGLNESHSVHQAMVRMAREVEEKTGGKLKIEVFPSGQLGTERESLEQLQMGCLDLAKSSAASLESFIPELSVFSLPYLFRDSGHFWRVLDGQIGRDLMVSGLSVDLRGICYYSSGSRRFYTASKPILTPDDLKGLKIRVIESPTSMALMRALGASPTPISFGELYTALQQGVVDGAENNEPSVATSRHYEVCKHYSMDEHTSIPDMLLVAENTWKRLSESERAILMQAAANSSVWQRQAWDESVKASLAQIEAAGTKIYHPDKRPFMEKVQPMLETYKGTPVWKVVEAIRATE